MFVVRLILRAFLWLAVLFRGTTLAGQFAASRMEDADGPEMLLLALMVPAELAERLDAVGGAAGVALAVTGKDLDEKILSGGLGSALLVLMADRKIRERRYYG